MITVKYFDPNNGRITEINHVGTVEYDNISDKDTNGKLYYLHDEKEYVSKDEDIVIDDTDNVKDLFSNTVDISKYSTFEEYIELHKADDNAFLPEIDPQSALNFIKRYLLGDNWFDSFTGSQGQLNSEIVRAIGENYAPKYINESADDNTVAEDIITEANIEDVEEASNESEVE
jgi:hypothetical protein